MQHSRVSRRGHSKDHILRALTSLADADGYGGLTVERILSRSGASRATFYHYFSSVDDCFYTAYREAAHELTNRVSASIAGRQPADLATLDAIVEFAISQPDTARLLMGECLVAGSAGRAARDSLISRLGRMASRSENSPRGIALPSPVLIGGIFRFLSISLANGLVAPDELAGVRGWALTFKRAQPSLSWRSPGVLGSFPPDSRPASCQALVPRGAPPRERIMRATAASVMERGYTAASVSHISNLACASRRQFYREFPGKAAAFMAAYEHAFQQMLATCTPAYFSSPEWPERVWQGMRAATGFIAREPALAHIGFVECHALGRAFARRVYDTQLAFTLFLEEGYRCAAASSAISRTSMVLSAAAIAEAAFHALRRAPSAYISRVQPLVVSIALTPFIGLGAADAFLHEKLPMRHAGRAGTDELGKT